MTGSTDPADLTAVELLRGYRSGALSPVEATRAALARAARAQELTNAFVTLDDAVRDEALAGAEASARRWQRGEPAGLLDGVPVTVKDMILQRGAPTLRGSRLVNPDLEWDEDGPSVARLREHGAVFLGKTTTPEFGWKGTTDSPLNGVTTNPYDTGRTTGGSSGGSGAAVALGAGPLSLGTDGGGSVRIPAAFCGIVALKATYGRVPLYPASPFGTLAHVGPMARDVRDTALLMDVVSGADPRDWSQLGPPAGGFVDALDGAADGVRGLRVAYSASFGGQVPVDRQVAAVVRAAVERLSDLGAYVEEADPRLCEGLAACQEAFHTLWFSGAARVVQPYGPQARERMDPGLREIVELGERYSALDYLAAVDVRMALGQSMGRFHQTYDVLVTPTVPITAFEAGAEVPKDSGYTRWTGWTPFTYPFNLTQQPALSLPCGVDGAGLPVGLQLVAARHRDALVLRTAQALYESGIADGIRPPESAVG